MPDTPAEPTPSPPPPGGQEARLLLCSCPVLDNARGRGYMGIPGVYVFSGTCPIHWPNVPGLEGQELPKSEAVEHPDA